MESEGFVGGPLHKNELIIISLLVGGGYPQGIFTYMKTIKINQMVGKYTVRPMDAMGSGCWSNIPAIFPCKDLE